MIGDSILLMFLGMGIVFLFLTLLMYCVRWLGLIVQRFFPQPSLVTQEKKISVPSGSGQSSATDQILTAVISAAINVFRKGSNR